MATRTKTKTKPAAKETDNGFTELISGGIGTLITPKSRVTGLHVERVHNLGNYENLRIGVSLEVGSDDDPGQLMRVVEKILADAHAKSPVDSWDLRRAKAVITDGPDKDMTKEQNRIRKEGAEKTIERHEAALARRKKAYAALSLLSYTSEQTDHKKFWDDYDDDFDPGERE